MACKSCHSENQRNFTGEIAIHFPGLAGLNKPIVLVFPTMMVCLECAFAQFAISDVELRVLREHSSEA
jgi:hypothetical protein